MEWHFDLSVAGGTVQLWSGFAIVEWKKPELR